MIKIKQAILSSVVYILTLILCYYIHMSRFRVDVVFYSAIADGLIAAFVSAAALFTLKYFRALGHFEKVQLCIIWILVGYCFAISVPTVIDRSLSFYLLEKLEQRGGAIRKDAFPRIFKEEYVKEHRLVDVRLTEQLESGTITIENGCVRLTPRGERLVRFSRYFRKNWLPKQRLVMGEYTDDLTDPFKHSSASADYTCK